MSLVKNLSHSIMDRIVDARGMTADSGLSPELKTLRSPMSPEPVGGAQVFRNDQGEKLVYIGLTVPMIKLDSHMVFSFAAQDSLLPHYTLDAVHAGDHYAFHLDLMPRVELATNLDYMKEVYNELTEDFQKTSKLEGLSEAHLSPMQFAVMSPWMLANRASESAMDSVGQTVQKYLDHWLKLMDSNLQSKAQMPVDLKERDRLHRAILFSPEVDPVWQRVGKLIGEESAESLRGLLLA